MASKVELYDNGVLVGTDNAPVTSGGTVTFSIDYTPTDPSDALVAKYFIDGVLQGESAVRNVTVDPAPTSNTPYEYFGLRKHNPAYAGPCITVKADGFATETDIGFDANGDLDTAAIAAISGTARFRITKLYGQYNGNILSQATEARMPIIMDSGATINMGGTETMYFNSINSQLVGPSTLTAENGLTVLIVAGTTSSTNSNKGLFGKWGTTAEYALLSHHFAAPNDVSIISKTTGDVQTNSQSAIAFPVNQLNLISAVWGATEQYVKINGVERKRSTISGVRAHTNPFVLGGYSEGGSNTDIQLRAVELLIYKSVVDPSADEASINTKYTIY